MSALYAVSVVTAPAVKSAFAYEQIRERIADGRLQPGSRLRLRELGEELGLSEMPVREALRMLQRDGMVEIQDHRGATVTEIPLDVVLEHVSTRMWLEALAVELTAPSLDPDDLARAEEAFARMDAAASTGDAAAFSAANRDFHAGLEAGGGGALVELIQSLWDRTWLARRQQSLFGRAPQRMGEAQREHADLLAAMRSGDADAAREAMLRHRAATLADWTALVEQARAAHV
jgi:DNA-binding GntR family transcriptional regulator